MLKRRLSLALFIVLAIAGFGRSSFADLLINGAGATFPYPIYSKWFDVYAKDQQRHFDRLPRAVGAACDQRCNRGRRRQHSR